MVIVVQCGVAVRASGDPGCLVANPSFELVAGGAAEGWTVLGHVSVEEAAAAHGSRAIRLSGPDTGSWAISAVYQDLVATSGDRFTVSVRVAHRSGDPIVESAKGIVNVLWVDGAGNDIFYETHEVLSPADPTDRFVARSFVSGSAPAGTAAARVFLAMLQSPAQESGAVLFDLAECVRNKDAYDASQWGDFPGGRTIEFGGHAWRVKGDGYYGPGPNWFSDDPGAVWVDSAGLHMTIATSGAGEPGTWSSTEIATAQPLGYGDYRFTTRGDLDALADNVVLGLFLWQYPPCSDGANRWNQHNEFDVEITRWGDPAGDNAQFVCQPWDWPGNIERFDIDYAEAEAEHEGLVTYAYRWRPDRVECRAWYGGAADEAPERMIRTWVYAGVHVPRPEQPRMHINLWHTGVRPVDVQEHHVEIAEFVFVPWASDADGDGALTVEDMYVQARTPADLNSDGQIDGNDAAHLETNVRVREMDDVAAGRSG